MRMNSPSNIMQTRPFFSIVLTLTLAATVAASENATSTSIPISFGGKNLARYRQGAGTFKPYVDELRTPSGKNILRDSPHDHIHHHALMYAIRVGGHNFWEESEAGAGKQIPGKLITAVGNNTKIESEISWNTSEPKTLLKETRKIGVIQGVNVVLLDWQSTLEAVKDTVLGDEGSGHYHGLGMRFVEEMDNGGRFFNSTGKNDGEIVRGDERLTLCKWIAYTAKLDGQPVTVAIFDHPSNPVPMTAFTMGDASAAFAYMSATTNFYRKPVKLDAGNTFSVKYRIAVWDGETPPEVIEKTYGDY
jgi:hypothetical protein